MEYSRKTNLTNTYIKKALITLLKDYKFNLITINQIIKEAEITRSTFYRYYEDKYDLLNVIEEEIIDRIKSTRNSVMNESTIPNNQTLSTELLIVLFNSLDAYADTISTLLSDNAEASFEMKLKNQISQRILILSNTFNISEVRSELVKEYLFAILIKTFQYWSANKDKVDIEEIASTFIDVQMNGLQKTIGLT
ncbi:TetR/AcrR family transcriptional regulator [Staphylococcus kloosii]|uniref:TetR/AcrR family transcriptional regulator n=1 Tax=Staphylococcus kloosii TaxID=29384 RepID=UPI0018A019F3|nr:TetR/AcrR family transcriptional regulator [Staphylococcus kloosii]MBF7025516.1 TetR/AcrR family transcriptional regulator [Staphylococcus kloosii]